MALADFLTSNLSLLGSWSFRVAANTNIDEIKVLQKQYFTNKIQIRQVMKKIVNIIGNTQEEIDVYKLKKENKDLKIKIDESKVKNRLFIRQLLESFIKQIQEDNEYTSEINFQDINKFLDSNNL